MLSRNRIEVFNRLLAWSLTPADKRGEFVAPNKDRVQIVNGKQYTISALATLYHNLKHEIAKLPAEIAECERLIAECRAVVDSWNAHKEVIREACDAGDAARISQASVLAAMVANRGGKHAASVVKAIEKLAIDGSISPTEWKGDGK